MLIRTCKKLISSVLLAGWLGAAIAESPPEPAVRPLPVAEQAARVRAELVAAALADLNTPRLARELVAARSKGRTNRDPRRLASRRAHAGGESQASLLR